MELTKNSLQKSNILFFTRYIIYFHIFIPVFFLKRNTYYVIYKTNSIFAGYKTKHPSLSKLGCPSLKSSQQGNRTPVFAVRGRRLSRLTNWPHCLFSIPQFKTKCKCFFNFFYFSTISHRKKTNRVCWCNKKYTDSFFVLHMPASFLKIKQNIQVYQKLGCPSSKSSQQGNRTPVFAVRGRRLSRLTNWPHCLIIISQFPGKCKSFFKFS